MFLEFLVDPTFLYVAGALGGPAGNLTTRDEQVAYWTHPMMIGGAVAGLVAVVGSIVLCCWVRRNPEEARRLRGKVCPCCGGAQDGDDGGGDDGGEPCYAACWCALCGPKPWEKNKGAACEVQMAPPAHYQQQQHGQQQQQQPPAAQYALL